MINDKNIILVVGDLGSGVNLLKNMLMLWSEIDWQFPNESDRFNYIVQRAYPTSLKNNLDNWMQAEGSLRNWGTAYGVTIEDFYADIATDQVISTTQTKKVLFLTHSVDAALRLKQQYPGIQLVSLYADNADSTKWQVDAYINKRTIEKVQNFSFPADVDTEKQRYIEEHGVENYYKFNILNMYEIINRRSIDYKNLPGIAVPISNLLTTDYTWIDNLIKELNSSIDVSQATDLIKKWQDLHELTISNISNPWFELIN